MSKIQQNLEFYTKKLRFKGYAKSTIDCYSYFLRLFLEYANKPLSHITKKDAYDFIDSCSDAEHGQKTQVISSLKLFYRFVVESELDKIKTERPRKKKRLPRVIESSVLEQKLSQIKNLKHKAILELGYRCGLRVSEVCNLNVTDIESDKMLILVRDSKFNKDRYCPMSKTLLRILREYYKVYRPNEFLFNGQHGRYSVSSCQKIFKKYIDENKSFHTCRHSGLTQMLNNGTNLRTIQSIAGHSSSKTTEIYTHVSNKLLQAAAL